MDLSEEARDACICYLVVILALIFAIVLYTFLSYKTPLAILILSAAYMLLAFLVFGALAMNIMHFGTMPLFLFFVASCFTIYFTYQFICQWTEYFKQTVV